MTKRAAARRCGSVRLLNRGGVTLSMLLAGVLLVACSKPAFTFRGYSANAACSEIIRAEQTLGVEVVGQRKNDMAEMGTLDVTELRGTVFDLPMFVEVACGQNDEALGVWYLAIMDNIDEQAAAYDRLSIRLAEVFGAAEESGDTGARSGRFLCDANGAVSLFEGSDEPLSPGGEVSVFVDLRPNVC